MIATHPDQALRMLDTATREEQSVLGAFRYTPNQAVLHTDTRLLPARASVRASWNYSQGCGGGPAAAPPRISYYLNRLQRLPTARDYIVTLGDSGDIDPARRIATMRYAHPVYTRESVAAQSRLPRPERRGHGLRRRLPRLGVPRGRLPVRESPPRAHLAASGDRRAV